MTVMQAVTVNEQRQVTEMKLAAKQATASEKPAAGPHQYVEFSIAAKAAGTGSAR